MVEMQNSSLTTIFTIINSMVGGAMLTYPILFKQSGVITSIIVLTVSAAISYKTCRIYVLHLGPKDNDAEDTIRRILGDKWEKYFRLITGFYLILLNIIYIVLIVDQVYNIIYFIASRCGVEDQIASLKVDELVFDKFSKQYLSLIMFLPLLAMAFLKNLNFLIKIAAYGVISVFIYFGFIIYEFFVTASDGKGFDDIKWATTDIGQLAGTSAVAFTVHTVIATVMKSNKNQHNNIRDLKISYLLGLIMYCAIGWIGSLAIINKQPDECKQTIVNCYARDVASIFVDVSYLYGRITVFPCFIEVGRSRLLLQFFPEIKPIHFRTFNILFMTVSILFSFLGPYVPLNTFMNLVGSLVCFFFIYFIPSILHLRCFEKNTFDSQKQSLLENETSGTMIQITDQEENQCGHKKQQRLQYSENVRKAGYLILNLIGIAIGVFGIYQVIDHLTKSKTPTITEFL